MMRRRRAARRSARVVTSPRQRTARPGPGNGWRQSMWRGRPSSAPERAHLVLEQLAQRLDELEVHLLGQAADVVVALDGRRRPLERDALDHVRVQRALREELARSSICLGLFLEDLDELAADDLALLLGVGDARERVEEPLAGVDDAQVGLEGVAEQRLDLPASPSRSRPLSTKMQVRRRRSPSDQRRRDRRIDAAREAAEARARRRRPARGPPRSPRRRTTAIVQSARRRRSRTGSSRGSRRRAACARPRGGTARPRILRAGVATAAAGQFSLSPIRAKPAGAPRRDRRGSSRPRSTRRRRTPWNSSPPLA